MKNSRRGFTLIELLVSISIIAILTGLLTVNFIGARQRGRDGKRKSDLYAMQSALELYRSDRGTYPTSMGICGESGISYSDTNGTATYLQEIPCDPLSNTNYAFSSNGSTYTLVACLENAQDSNKDDTKDTISCSTSAASFTLRSP